MLTLCNKQVLISVQINSLMAPVLFLLSPKSNLTAATLRRNLFAFLHYNQLAAPFFTISFQEEGKIKMKIKIISSKVIIIVELELYHTEKCINFCCLEHQQQQFCCSLENMNIKKKFSKRRRCCCL